MLRSATVREPHFIPAYCNGRRGFQCEASLNLNNHGPVGIDRQGVGRAGVSGWKLPNLKQQGLRGLWTNQINRIQTFSNKIKEAFASGFSIVALGNESKT